MVSLSGSYEKTSDFLEAGKGSEAREEFRVQFVPVVKKLYTEAPKTYPTRFAKFNDWCTWVRKLYVMSMTAEKTLAGGDLAASKKALAELRAHFYGLHRETETLKVNDWIYAFIVAANQDSPDTTELRKLCESVEKAQLSTRAKANAEAFNKAKTRWLAQVRGVLQDGAIAPAEVGTLRSASASFYRAFGMQFE